MLEALAKYPLVTYVFGFTEYSQWDQAFQKADLSPKIFFTASDAGIIKTYVKMNMGVGIVASMAYDPKTDTELVSINAGHLFEAGITKIGFRRGTFLRVCMYEFIKLFAPHLTQDII